MKQLIISGGQYKNLRIRCPAGEIRPAMNNMREAVFQILDNYYHFSCRANEKVTNKTRARNSNSNNSCTSGAQANNEQPSNKASNRNNATNTSDLSFLDLFSGSGLMAIEAVSRGITRALAVEVDKIKWRTIQENFSVNKKALQLARMPAERFLLKSTQVYNIIYSDPPFRYIFKDDLMHKIVASASCSPTSIVVIHTPKREQLSAQYGPFILMDRRIYSNSAVCFYKSK